MNAHDCRFVDPMKQLKSQPLPWQSFENEVADYIKRALSGGKLGLDKRFAHVTPNRQLYSKDRDSEIVFDIVIEVFSSMNSQEPWLIWLWECKNYPTRRVTVDEVEEFHCKKMQVGAHKGTIITRFGFQEGAICFAKSNGIGLMTLNKKKVSALALSKDAGIIEFDGITGTYCLYTFGMEIGGSSKDEGPYLSTMIAFEISNPSSFQHHENSD